MFCALGCALLLGAAPAAAPGPAVTGLQTLLAMRRAALARLHVREPRRLEISGTLSGLDLRGSFHVWRDGEDERADRTLGVEVERTLRLGSREYVQNAGGEVRELYGLLLARRRTGDLVESGAFLEPSSGSVLLGAARLPDGRAVYEVRVAPPGGQPETVALDARTAMIDRVSYADEDGVSDIDYGDYRVVGGALVAMREVHSNGDHRYDLTQRVTGLRVDEPIDPRVFAPFVSTTIDTPAPVTVPLIYRGAHYYVEVGLRGHRYRFLLDSGAQAVVVDSRVAAAALLLVQGSLEVAGATRTGGLGLAPLASVSIGPATLPLRVVSVLDLRGVNGGAFPIDGILGYPFFAAAEVRIDPDRRRMTFGKPGSLPPLGSKLDLDTDRELPETTARIDGFATRVLLDTGNGTDLLLFRTFLNGHPGAINAAGASRVTSYGVGGASQAVGALVGELDLGPYRLFNRYADVMLNRSGAFADRFDGGNVGLGSLDNFIMTFDLADRACYLQPGAHFDDGRYRPITDRQ